MTRAVVVVLLLVLAGCSGFGGSSGPTTPSTTLTPVDVPERSTAVGATPRPSTPEDRLASGLAESGVFDPFALAGAHRSALANRSYTKTTRATLSGPNGTLRSVTREMRVAAGGRRYHLVETSASDPAYPVRSFAPRLEIWYDDGPALFRVGTGENVTYRVGMTGTLGGPVGDISGHDRLVGLYGTVDRWRVTAGAEDTWILESREPPDADVLQVPVLVEEPRDPRLQVVVTTEGRVVSHRLTYEANFEGTPVAVTRRVQFTNVGETVVDQPAWYDEARSETADETRGDR